ncbi:hypothetical protein AS594_35380 [Streptomyces agglomeratus]|uniref:DUF676 domain-containing protein n=1 Tax=Streptomyces agglomeratus TaxID=285458 RepID=A0A1E5PHS3_9ACTN|nr:hypothetical protein [Streptomyces agglomeratus]OEJ28924.1 hypothetical protein AS594_35380 [Streptomyces agglomeratus]
MAQEARIDVELTWKQSEEESSAGKVAEFAKTLPQGPWFGTPTGVARDSDRKPKYTWPLRSARPYRREVALGEAAVYLADGHDELERPFIFADGFNYGRSDLPGLFAHFNAPYPGSDAGFFEQLLTAGIDVVLVGFEERHTYIQANAGVVISAITKVIAERHGQEPLIVGGVSMGGIITRYALAEMESQQQDHQTATYLSWDSPHNGAWIPLILQQMAYFFEALPAEPGKVKEAELIRSPAAQQLLYAWVPDAKYEGPVAASSALRTQFLAELRDLGQFPRRPRKLGVANGTGNGTGRDLPAGAEVFKRQVPLVVYAQANFQPDGATRQPIGEMRAAGQVRRGFTSYVPGLDGSPGGTLGSFGEIAGALGADIPEEYRFSCFVPSVSAVALDYDPAKWEVNPYEKVEAADEKSALDEFKCDSENTEHSQVTKLLVDWIMERIVP